MTKLYIVEGLPCSGKSTTAKFVADALAAEGRNAIYVDEGTGNHPADYEFHAYISHSNFTQFPEQVQTQVKKCAERSNDGYIVPLSQFGGEDFQKLLQYKIYDFLPWEEEMPLMIDRWQRFAESAKDDEVFVFNCVFLQNPMCETMMRFGFSEKQSFGHIAKIAELIKPLDPAVIYLKNDDIADRVTETAKERDGWLEAVTDYHVNGGYGKSINAQGFEGYISCLEERQRRELSILNKLAVRSIVIDNAHRDWEGAYQKIAGFIAVGNRAK